MKEHAISIILTLVLLTIKFRFKIFKFCKILVLKVCRFFK